MKIQSKLPNVGTTIFTVMTNLANEYGAINLSQGFPDFPVDPEIISLVDNAMRRGFNQYAPMPGLPELREKISLKIKELYGGFYDPGMEITVTTGATEALFAAISAVVHPGDEVIIFEPAYDSYIPAIELSGGIPVFIKLDFPDYSIDWNRVKDSLSPRTKLLIINSPHNPSGAVLDSGDIAALRALAASDDFFIISDEVYEHIIFDGIYHESLARYPDLAARSFVISSFGKTYHATGWKMGYCAAPDYLTKEFRKIHQYLTFASSTPVQHALAAFMDNKKAYTELPSFYQEKRDTFLARIATSRFKITPSKGTYFQMLDYSAISEEGDMEFAKRLTMEYGVASIPPSVFYHERDDHRVLRFCFAKKNETLTEAAKRLCAI